MQAAALQQESTTRSEFCVSHHLPHKSDNERYRILVVDDDPNIARLMMANLTKVNMECRHAPDGDTALRIYNQVDPHLVLLDLSLPNTNGYAVCVRLRQRSAVPIIVVTAHDDIENQLHAFQVGADDYLAKPFDVKVLLARTVAHLRRVYRYDVDVSSDEPPVQHSNVPSGWATCESCNYIGPGAVFHNSDSQHKLMCPHCRSTSRVSFALR